MKRNLTVDDVIFEGCGFVHVMDSYAIPVCGRKRIYFGRPLTVSYDDALVRPSSEKQELKAVYLFTVVGSDFQLMNLSGEIVSVVTFPSPYIPVVVRPVSLLGAASLPAVFPVPGFRTLNLVQGAPHYSVGIPDVGDPFFFPAWSEVAGNINGIYAITES